MQDLSFDLATLRRAFAAGTPARAVVAEAYRRLAAADDPGIFIAMVPEADALADADALGPFDPTKPLWGIPFAVKDNIDTKGLPTTAACPDFAYMPAADATVVARLKAAGAVLLGKTNLDQFATGLVGVRSPYPVPRNACDPQLVPGGSSSGSAVAVARGIVSFSLGTDTAGSGRVPAGLNNIVGLKPSVGLVPATGVVPACRTLDCVSIFAGCVDDAHAVLGVMAGADPADPYTRPMPVGPAVAPPQLRVGIPTPDSLRFFGDDLSVRAFATAVADVAATGAKMIPVDLAPFYAVADLLYEGAWVAERHAAVEAFLNANPDSFHPVTRGIIEGAKKLTATDAFRGFYKLQAAKAALGPVLDGLDILLVPTMPYPVTLEEIAREPIAANSRNGTYTNFVNLMDLAAIAVPGRFRDDGRPAGVTLIGKAGTDGMLAGFGRTLHEMVQGATVGATGFALPLGEPLPAEVPAGLMSVAVVGAHLSGMPLNRQLTDRGGIFIRTAATAPDYRFYALPGGPPFRPGLVRVPEGTGGSIALEIWALPPAGFGEFVSMIPSPLGIGMVRLSDGGIVQGFVCEAIAAEGAEDITDLGGWRAFVARAAA